MNPLEIVRNEMDARYFAKVEQLIAEGATWVWANFTNEAALEGPETPEGLRQFYIVVDFDEETYETSDLFEELIENDLE
jgi:hypothetical protein